MSFADAKPVDVYLSRFEKLKSERGNYNSLCQEVADYTLPSRDFTVTRAPSEKRNVKIYDSTAIEASRQLASGLHGYLTPPATKWFVLRVKGIKESLDDRKWLDQVTDVIFLNFSSPDSLFASQSFEMYQDLVAFGQGVMFPTFVDGKVTYISRPLNKCWVAQSNVGIINTLYYSDWYLPVEIIRMAEISKWEIDPEITKAYHENKQEKFEVLHAVQPRDEHYGPGSVAEKKPFASVYIDVKNKKIMKESGFDTFPYLVPRFSKRSGETYGYGPGMDALPEARTVNEFQEVLFRAAAKNADPPMLSPVEGAILPMRLDPGGINFYDPDLPKPEFWSNGFQPQYLNELVAQKQQLIKDMYFSMWMSPSDKRDLSATEVIDNAQRSMRQMGPALSRLSDEYLSKLINRTFEILFAHKLLPPPPSTSQGKPIAIEYTSPMAQAQRLIGAQPIMQGLSMVAQLAQFDPSVAHNIDANKMTRDQLLNTFNFPAEYLVDEDDVKAAQDQQAQASEVAQAGPVAQAYGTAANQIAQAGKQQ